MSIAAKEFKFTVFKLCPSNQMAIRCLPVGGSRNAETGITSNSTDIVKC